jgi:hypothetical protein
MTDNADALTQARAEAAAWTERIAELETQAPQAEVPTEPTGLPPRQFVQDLHARLMANGAREEDAAAAVFNAMARKAQSGDRRFIVGDDGSVFHDDIDV